MSKANICAVLTGDLMRSRQAGAAGINTTFDILRDAADTFGAAHELHLRFTRFRGDGWQIVLEHPGLLLDAALYLTARLRAGGTRINTRMAIGVGPVENLGSADLSDANGPAFFTSGDLLEQLPRNRLFALAGSGIGPAQVAIIDLAEWIAGGWTAAQAEAVAIQLANRQARHEDIAEQLGITRQAVQSRIAGAGLSYFDNAFYALRHHDYASH